MSAKEQMIHYAREGKVLTHKCTKCGHPHLSTVYFCQGCGAKGFEPVVLDGRGSVATYTIITVPPDGFEEYAPYAFVVMSLDDSELRISGFMAGIATPADLPVGTRARITGFDKRGIVISKDDGAP